MPKKMTIGGVEVENGARVSGDVKWKDGRVTCVSGSLVAIYGDFVYIETSIGVVESPIDSVELCNG